MHYQNYKLTVFYTSVLNTVKPFNFNTQLSEPYIVVQGGNGAGSIRWGNSQPKIIDPFKNRSLVSSSDPFSFFGHFINLKSENESKRTEKKEQTDLCQKNKNINDTVQHSIVFFSLIMSRPSVVLSYHAIYIRSVSTQLTNQTSAL